MRFSNRGSSGLAQRVEQWVVARIDQAGIARGQRLLQPLIAASFAPLGEHLRLLVQQPVALGSTASLDPRGCGAIAELVLDHSQAGSRKSPAGSAGYSARASRPLAEHQQRVANRRIRT